MNVRTPSDLIDYLANQKQIRKRELISLKGQLNTPKSHQTPTNLRVSVVFAYAHWEGFVKDAAISYVTHAVFKSRPLRDFSNCFKAMACRGLLIAGAKATKRIRPHLDIVDRLTTGSGIAASVNPTAAIDTESNLNAEVFENVCVSIGLDFEKDWQTVAPFMNDLLLQRCAIAHGELSTPPIEFVSEALDFVIKSIDQFATQIENAAVTRAFLSL